ncbi:trypsin alpha-3-like isoform X3 [Daphnia pulicaria]|uniref:trypsin alpha-3-like isoform X3 n=1 Tax=Daphnia pulicaria TaxID=35523 RepID=UPI001EEC5D52|nr:trypsin alpha-3-like isoform X3 [Daphnia pulicaria]
MSLTLSALALLYCLVWSVHSKSLLPLFNPPTISIVGGTPAAEGEFPYVTVLRLSNSLCGGSLIGPSHVLTAAHCLTRFTQASVTSFRVLINTLSVNGGGPNSVTRGVKRFIIHEAYNPNNNNNDVALLVLNSSVAANSTFLKLPTDPAATTLRTTSRTTTGRPITTKAPACSCTCPTTTTKRAVAVTTKKPVAVLRGFRNYANVSAIIAGWGTTSFGGSISSTLLKANVTILDNSDPKCAVYGSSFIGANMLCAAAPGKDTCQGDSGGPIFVNGVVVGITSFGNGCADPRFAGVYARVSAYVGWIQTTQANNP